MGRDTDSRDLEPFDLDEDFGDSWDLDEDDDFVDIDLDFGKAKKGPVPEEIFERPVRRIERVADDPYADHDRMEDVTSERYQRKTEDTGRKSGKKSGGGLGGSKMYLILIVVCLAVVAIIMLVLKMASGNGGENETTTPAPVETNASAVNQAAVWEENANADVQNLVNQYYTAMAAVDLATLQNVLDPSVTIDEARLNAEAQVIEAYQNITCYTTAGKADGEYAVYIAFAMKFKNIETVAPGLVPAYVKTDANGALKLITWDVAQKDEELFLYIGTVANCDTIRNLATQIEEDYQAAINGDSTLATFLNSLNGNADETTAAPQETTPEESTPAETTPEETTPAETSAAETTASSSSEQTFEEVDTMRYTTTDVKARKAPNTDDSTEFTLVEKGTYLHMFGQSAEWGKVHLEDGSTAYIKLDYLSPYEPAADAE